MRLRRICLLALAFVIIVSATMPVYAAAEKNTDIYVQNIINYYRCYQEEALPEIQAWTDALALVDAEQAAAWEKIVNSWQWVDQSMGVSYEVLPDGLPQDESLGIVVMGYALNPDGSMRQELYDRLAVALSSARYYPQAYVICTGGGTAQNSDETEAHLMAAWLRDQGIDSNRIIVEDASLSTNANAENTYALILKRFPKITSLAVITSDYHIYRSVLMFRAVSDYANLVYGTRAIDVVGNACCMTREYVRESTDYLAQGLAYFAGITLDTKTKPELFAAKVNGLS